MHTLQFQYVSLTRDSFNSSSKGGSSGPLRSFHSIMGVHKDLKSALAILRQREIRLIIYIDDMLLIAVSKDQALDQAQALLYLLECLGFTVNTEYRFL